MNSNTTIKTVSHKFLTAGARVRTLASSLENFLEEMAQELVSAHQYSLSEFYKHSLIHDKRYKILTAKNAVQERPYKINHTVRTSNAERMVLISNSG
jgi:hypothetical protein